MKKVILIFMPTQLFKYINFNTKFSWTALDSSNGLI